jgi:alkanesulfonate monooxygenase SsuD/methylene tetrahydromethanopterin reductase-like flavin-dependent oxidoreductase (luciferase family)
VKYSVFMNIQTPRSGKPLKQYYDERLAQAEWAERLGFEAVFLAEHAFVDHGKPSPAVILSNIAARTTRIRLGMAVSVLPWHQPIELAQDYATVDVLSGGRLDFGVGRGLFKCEFDGYNVPWEEAQERFEESLEVILEAWKGQRFSYAGKFFRVNDVEVSPRPLQRPHPPLWQPCLSPGSMEKALRRGITPILGASLSPLPDLKKQFDKLNAIVADLGQHDAVRVGHPFVYVSDSSRRAREEARAAIEWYLQDFASMFTLRAGEVWPDQYKYYEPWAQYIQSLTADRVLNDDLMWVGDVDFVTHRMRWLRDECKVNYVLSNMGFGGLDHALVLKSMELLATKVMPAVA